MAQSEDGYDLYGVYAAVSVSSDSSPESPKGPDGTRHLTLMERPGGPDDPYGGFKQVDSLHGVEVSNLPDGRQLDTFDCTAYGYEDDEDLVAVYVTDDDPQKVTVAWHGPEAQ